MGNETLEAIQLKIASETAVKIINTLSEHERNDLLRPAIISYIKDATRSYKVSSAVEKAITEKAIEYIENPEIQGFIEQKAMMLTEAYVKAVHTELANDLFKNLKWDSAKGELKRILNSIKEGKED